MGHSALATAREVAGVTQEGLANRAHVSQAYIGKMERGDANPTVGQLGRLLASIWMKVEMRTVPLDATQSVESVRIEVAEATGPDGFGSDSVTVTNWEGVRSSTSGTYQVITAAEDN